MQRFYLFTFHILIKRILSKKRILMNTNQWLLKGQVLQRSRTGWSSNLILIISHFLLYQKRGMKILHFYFFLSLGQYAILKEYNLNTDQVLNKNNLTSLIAHSERWLILPKRRNTSTFRCLTHTRINAKMRWGHISIN